MSGKNLENTGSFLPKPSGYGLRSMCLFFQSLDAPDPTQSHLIVQILYKSYISIVSHLIPTVQSATSWGFPASHAAIPSSLDDAGWLI